MALDQVGIIGAGNMGGRNGNAPAGSGRKVDRSATRIQLRLPLWSPEAQPWLRVRAISRTRSISSSHRCPRAKRALK